MVTFVTTKLPGDLAAPEQHKICHLKRAHEAPDVLHCAYEAHGAQKTVLRGSKTIEAVLPAVSACARSRHAGIYARRTQCNFSRSQDYKPLCKWTSSCGLTLLSGRNSGLPMPQDHIVAVLILHMFQVAGPMPCSWAVRVHTLKRGF